MKFVCGRKENIPNIATSSIVNDFAGWSIYRQTGIQVVILIRKTIATLSFIIFMPDQLNDFSHFSLRPRMQ